MPIRTNYFPRDKDDVPVTVGTALTEVFSFATDGRPYLSGSLSNAGTAAIDDFRLQIKTHPAGGWWTVLNADWSTLSTRLLAVSGDPSALASGNEAHFQCNLLGAWAVRGMAAVASGESDVSFRGNAV